LRVISGELGGRRLNAAKGSHTRPTADRVREALFSILADNVVGANVLDLFAGTGALSIEALSRGAAFALVIDNHTEPLSVIKQNIHMCQLETRCRIIKWDIRKNLACLKSDLRFDLVFIDPPYNSGVIPIVLNHLLSTQSLSPNARIVVEHGSQESLPEAIHTLMQYDQRKYGQTVLSFYQEIG
jgi:16S rRNA (guanine966-N2)-methyltransferase